MLENVEELEEASDFLRNVIKITLLIIAGVVFYMYYQYKKASRTEYKYLADDDDKEK